MTASSMRDPDSTVFETQVHYTIPSGNQIIHYVDPAKCGGGGYRYGALSISP